MGGPPAVMVVVSDPVQVYDDFYVGSFLDSEGNKLWICSPVAQSFPSPDPPAKLGVAAAGWGIRLGATSSRPTR